MRTSTLLSILTLLASTTLALPKPLRSEYDAPTEERRRLDDREHMINYVTRYHTEWAPAQAQATDIAHAPAAAGGDGFDMNGGAGQGFGGGSGKGDGQAFGHGDSDGGTGPFGAGSPGGMRESFGQSYDKGTGSYGPVGEKGGDSPYGTAVAAGKSGFRGGNNQAAIGSSFISPPTSANMAPTAGAEGNVKPKAKKNGKCRRPDHRHGMSPDTKGEGQGKGSDPKVSPEPQPEGQDKPAPTPAPAPAPAPTGETPPAPVPAPEPTSQASPEPAPPAPAPSPAPAVNDNVDKAPEPAPSPEPKPTEDQKPEPAPTASEAEAQPQPSTDATPPEPAPTTEAAPAPEAAPTPAHLPDAQPEPSPGPEPTPKKKETPSPAPEPAPEPSPEPQVLPEPEPVPEPPAPVNNAAAGGSPGSPVGLAVNGRLPIDVASFGGGLGWYYDWDVKPLPGYEALEFVPMLHGRKWVDEFTPEQLGGAKYALSFNEPNIAATAEAGGSGMSFQDAAELHKRWTAMAPADVKIGSISPSRGGSGFFKKWYDACGGESCRMDFVTFHFYGINIDQLKAEVEQYKGYGKPIWVTEVACREYREDSPNNWVLHHCSNEERDKLMSDMITYFNAEPQIERWAWFGSVSELVETDDENSIVDKAGKANDLGKLYAANKH